MSRPSFGLSRWSAADDDDFAAWQRHLDAVRQPLDPALEARILANEAAVLGRPARRPAAVR